MNYSIFIILLILIPIGFFVWYDKRNKKNPEKKINTIALIILIFGPMIISLGTPRVYVVTVDKDGEYSYYTKVTVFGFTHVTEDNKKIEVSPVFFGCGVLNLTKTDMQLYPVVYGDYQSNNKGYYIYKNSYMPTEEWNVDVFPPDRAPNEVSSKSSSTVKYVLSVED